MPYCTMCGTEVSSEYLFCIKCGCSLSKDNTNKSNTQAAEKSVSMIDYINEEIKNTSVYIDALSYINGTKPITLGAFARRIVSNIEQYEIPLNKPYDIDEMTVILSNGLATLPFSNWKRGVPATFGFANDDQRVIQFTFNEQTVHRIVFDEKKTGVYKIEAICATRKERIKYMSSRDGLMLKNLTKIKPIIKCAVDYCFINVL